METKQQTPERRDEEVEVGKQARTQGSGSQETDGATALMWKREKGGVRQR